MSMSRYSKRNEFSHPDYSFGDRLHQRQRIGPAKSTPSADSIRVRPVRLQGKLAAWLDFCAAMAWNG
jgi:hypothetical protein